MYMDATLKREELWITGFLVPQAKSDIKITYGWDLAIPGDEQCIEVTYVEIPRTPKQLGPGEGTP